MEQIILDAIRAGGPVFGPLLFLVAIGFSWGYHGLLRQVSMQQNRFALILLDKKVVTLRELVEYGCLSDTGGALSDLARIRKGAI